MASAAGLREERQRVMIVAGPTAVGKSAAAMGLCERYGGEIVSADSVQLYRGLDVGSNKPSAEEQAKVRHHLVDSGDPSAPWTAGEWCRAAAAAIEDICGRGKLPVVVGGTMMYAQWLARGAPDAPPASAEAAATAHALVTPYETAGDWDAAAAAISARGPAFASRAARLSRNDWYRLSRAVEIELDLEALAAATPERGDARRPPPRRPVLDAARYDVRCAFLAPADRARLFHGIDARCDLMLEADLLGEVASLRVAGGLPDTSTAARAIGYRQSLDYLDARLERDATTGVETAPADVGNPTSNRDPKPPEPGTDADDYLDFCRKFRTASRNYAAEQIKWYRRDATFAIVPAGTPTLLDDLLHADRDAYDALLGGDAQKTARAGLVADKKQMKAFASAPCAAEKSPRALADHLSRADAAVARLRAAQHAQNAEPTPEPVANNTVRLNALKRRRDGQPTMNESTS